MSRWNPLWNGARRAMLDAGRPITAAELATSLSIDDPKLLRTMVSKWTERGWIIRSDDVPSHVPKGPRMLMTFVLAPFAPHDLGVVVAAHKPIPERAPRAPKPKKEPKPKPEPKPKKPPAPKADRTAKAKTLLSTTVVFQKPKRSLDQSLPVVIPPGVKVTKCPGFEDRRFKPEPGSDGAGFMLEWKRMRE